MQNDPRLDWFREARYGLFIHFGLYSVLGGFWNGRRTPQNAEWIMRHLEIPVREYRRLAETFDPCAFDADALVREARENGFRYVVFTAKHHDGFAMYDSRVSDYNVMHTPYGRDPLRAVADACRKYGMRLGIYYSQMQDWDDPDGDGNTWDYPAEGKDFRRYFEGKVLPQVRELLTGYGDVSLLWFDTPYDMEEPLCRRLANEVHRLAPDCLISGRIGYGLGDYYTTGDRAVPAYPFSRPFEVPMTVNNTWGYASDDFDFKSAEEIRRLLVASVGKGGNLLLNIGPDGEGNVPEGELAPLRAVGAFLKQNGESIYGAGEAPELPYQPAFGGMTYRADTDTLYFHVSRLPNGRSRTTVIGLVTPALRAELLATGEPVAFTQFYERARDEYRLVIYLPDPAVVPSPVVALHLDGEARVQRM